MISLVEAMLGRHKRLDEAKTTPAPGGEAMKLASIAKRIQVVGAIAAAVLLGSAATSQPATPAAAVPLFAGPINAVASDEESSVLIVPTNEKDKAVQQRIHDYVTAIRDRFYVGAPILTDTEALEQDLSAESIVVYGTPQGNLWLAKLMEALPVRIEPEKIESDRTYTGTQLRLITVWPNPGNPQKGVLIYTAQRADDVPGMNGVFHGPTDWVIALGAPVVMVGGGLTLAYRLPCGPGSDWTSFSIVLDESADWQHFRQDDWGGQYGPAASKADLLTCMSNLERLQIRRPWDGALDRIVGLDNVMLNAGPRAE